jgi:alpha-D-ribose 1-methylphosphonate 5-triphosphate diphosphatase PhnM
VHHGLARERQEIEALDDEVIAALAKAAGLDKALAEFPADVAAAARQAWANAGLIVAPADPAAEPWPPMRPNPAA